eukprot:gene18765-25297_t
MHRALGDSNQQGACGKSSSVSVFDLVFLPTLKQSISLRIAANSCMVQVIGIVLLMIKHHVISPHSSPLHMAPVTIPLVQAPQPAVTSTPVTDAAASSTTPLLATPLLASASFTNAADSFTSTTPAPSTLAKTNPAATNSAAGHNPQLQSSPTRDPESSASKVAEEAGGKKFPHVTECQACKKFPHVTECQACKVCIPYSVVAHTSEAQKKAAESDVKEILERGDVIEEVLRGGKSSASRSTLDSRRSTLEVKQGSQRRGLLMGDESDSRFQIEDLDGIYKLKARESERRGLLMGDESDSRFQIEDLDGI